MTYRDVDEILEKISKAPKVSREEQEVKSKYELMKSLKKGIVILLKKGYSVKATVKFVNQELSLYEITEEDVEKLLPKVTSKRRTLLKKLEKKSPKEASSDPADLESEQETRDIGEDA
jgi:hypothetical protein